MRYFIYILAIYLVSLSSLPCADLEIGSSAHSVTQHQAEKKSHSHDKENDLCSPFCSCGCCGAHVLTYEKLVVITFQKWQPVIKKQLPSYTSNFNSEFYFQIWQPPQLV